MESLRIYTSFYGRRSFLLKKAWIIAALEAAALDLRSIRSLRRKAPPKYVMNIHTHLNQMYHPVQTPYSALID